MILKPLRNVRYNCPIKEGIVDGTYCLTQCQVYANKNCIKFKRDKK